MELIIDTATADAAIALSHEGEMKVETRWAASQNHTVDLIPNIINLLQEAGSGLEDVKAIVVSIGPGSFNGLRVGVGTAKGLAFSMDTPLVGIGTLEAEALPHAEEGLPILAVQDAGRGEIAAAMYQQRGEWKQLAEPHITTIDELCAHISSPAILCGSFAKNTPSSPDIPHEIEERLGELAIVRRNADGRARALSALGWRRLERGGSDPLAALQPLYLRRPSITKPRKDKR